MDRPHLSLPDMPFYWRIRRSSAERHATIPPRLPFSFGLVTELNLLVENRDDTLLRVLEAVYKEESNVGFLQDGHTLAAGYGGDFLDFIRRTIEPRDVKDVVEIGCGGCYLLDKLRESGFRVTGVDPSPIAVARGKEKNIRVIPDFFPSPQLDFKTDLIFHVDVLEHVNDPVRFLGRQKEGLNPDGKVIINVPDCSASIACGDLSIAFHQHLNSFDDRSLYNTVVAAGLHVVTIEKSNFGGSLYCLASVKPPSRPFQVGVPESAATDFFRKAATARARFEGLVRPLADRRANVGFYVPLRAIPYLASVGFLDTVRLFDDIAHWHGGYIDGLDTPIENYEDLIRNPVEHLFIMSLTFGEHVRNKVLAKQPGMAITTLREIVS